MNPNERKAPIPQEFTSWMSKWELAAALLYLPLHIWLLPLLLTRLPAMSGLSDLKMTLLVYGIGTGYMLLVLEAMSLQFQPHNTSSLTLRLDLRFQVFPRL